MKSKPTANDDGPDSAHEGVFIRAFIVPKQRKRYLQLLAKPKRRDEILERFDHFFDFISEHTTKIQICSTASGLAQVLRLWGASQAGYIIGGKGDRWEMPLQDAIEISLESACGTVISCIPGRLALYLQKTPPGGTFILHYPQKRDIDLEA